MNGLKRHPIPIANLTFFSDAGPRLHLRRYIGVCMMMVADPFNMMRVMVIPLVNALQTQNNHPQEKSCGC